METLSPATALRDMTVKKEIYQAAGVEEYWIISPKERAVQIYYLEDGKYDLKYSYILQDDPEEEHYNNILQRIWLYQKPPRINSRGLSCCSYYSTFSNISANVMEIFGKSFSVTTVSAL